MHLTDNQNKVRDALLTDSTATPAVVAEATGLAYSTVTRLLRELAEAGAAVKDSDGWRRADTDTDTDADTERVDAEPDLPAPHQPRMGKGQRRMGKGQLREGVLAALRAASEPLGPTQLSKVLDGKSQGAISNACDRLVTSGDAVLVSESPRRFQAARAT